MRNIYTPSNARFISELETTTTTTSHSLDGIITDDDLIEVVHGESGDVVYLVPTGISNPSPTDVIAVYFHDWAGCILSERTGLNGLTAEEVRAQVYEAMGDMNHDKSYEIVVESEVNFEQDSYTTTHTFKGRGAHPLDSIMQPFYVLAVCLVKDLEEPHWYSNDGFDGIKDMISRNEPLIYKVNGNTYTLKSIKQFVTKEVLVQQECLEDI